MRYVDNPSIGEVKVERLIETFLMYFSQCSMFTGQPPQRQAPTAPIHHNKRILHRD